METVNCITRSETVAHANIAARFQKHKHSQKSFEPCNTQDFFAQKSLSEIVLNVK